MHCFVETALLIKTKANYFYHVRIQKAKNIIEETHAKVNWQKSAPFFWHNTDKIRYMRFKTINDKIITIREMLLN